MRSLYYILLFTIFISCTYKDEVTDVYITTHEQIKWEEKIPCVFKFSDGISDHNLIGEIKFRGGMSSRYEKHSYSLKLDEAFPVVGLPKGKKWIINANYIDKTFMRHKLSFDLFRQMSSNNHAPRCRYVNMFRNETYFGLYVLMERMDKRRLKLNTNDKQAMIFKDVPVFRNDTSGLMKYEFQKYPDESKWIHIEAFRNFLKDAPKEVFVEKIDELIDIENVIDWQLLLYFTNNGDGLLKNFYLYKVDSSTPFRIAIWDYDHSFGRDGDNELNMLENTVGFERSLLFSRLMKDKRYMDKLEERWGELRQSGVFSRNNFKNMVDENHAVIQSHIKRNFDRWSVDEKWYYDSNTYKMELDTMLKFVDMNLDTLDRVFNYSSQNK